MPKLEFVSEFAAPVERLWAFYNNLDALLTVTPPGTRVRVVDPPNRLQEGASFTLIVSQPPVYLPIPWETFITAHEPPYLFVDEQGKGPFKRWRHEHRFERLPDGRSRLRDVISYQPPFGILGAIADRLFLRRTLVAMFEYRHRVTREQVDGVTGLI